MRLIQRRRRSGLTPPSICVVFRSVSPARPAAGDHQRAPFAGLKCELTPASWGKMARCSKAIFRVRWGLSESGLMAAGDLPALLGASHRKTATGVSPVAHPVLLQRGSGGGNVGRVSRRRCPALSQQIPTERRQAKVREPRCAHWRQTCLRRAERSGEHRGGSERSGSFDPVVV